MKKKQGRPTTFILKIIIIISFYWWLIGRHYNRTILTQKSNATQHKIILKNILIIVEIKYTHQFKVCPILYPMVGENNFCNYHE